MSNMPGGAVSEFYYEIALLKSPIAPLTYQSDEDIKTGALVQVKLRNRKNLSDAVVVKKVAKPDFKCIAIDEITEQFYDNKMVETAQFISQYYVCSLGEALSLYVPYDEAVSNEKAVRAEFESDILLSSKQQEAYDFLEQNKTALLFANTGSGKTEIYIKTIENHLNNGKQALLLMPEISLTPQMQKRLEKIFGKSVALWHSKITKAKKKKIIEGLLSGKIKIIAGARSALFLPYDNLGVIIVDEEHDESYKSEQKPRYNAKDLSLYIAKKYDIQIILGSATPSIGSFYKIPYFRLTQTYFDSKKHILFDESPLKLNDFIKDKIEQTIKNNKQVILFLPTRANFKYQICSDCGKSVECPFCSVSMSLHKQTLSLKCHYCGYMQRIPQHCPSCKTGIVHNIRLGTAEVTEQLQEHFIGKTVEKFDRDSVKTDKQLREILNNFNDENIDILVGTQMLSKGHDYHNVALAVVLGIDSVLNMTSYKARERALSLLIQIAGRSGRNGFGEVIVQTKNREFFEHYLIKADYEEFLKSELEFRQELYPPKVRMARVLFAHKNGIIAAKQMKEYLDIFKQLPNIQVIGAGESTIFKIAGKYRYEILLRSSNTKALLNALHSIDSNIVSIDMDTLY